MKEKRYQGFTLIELLAVIVILAVIALIATPLIMNVINDSKKSVAQDSGYSIIRAGELEAASTKKIPPIHYDEDSDLELKGDKPSSFNLDFNDNMDASLKAWINGYCVVKSYDSSKVTVDESKKTEADCVTGGGSSSNKKYANGEVIYFNPETNTKCSASEYKTENSLNQNKSGCMKWYAFNDSESSSTVNVILDHNTTYKVAWNSSGTNAAGMKEVKEALDNDTETWNASLKPRLIEANEIAKITGNTEFDANVVGKDNWFYFETNKQNDPTIAQGAAKYKWLFDYTQGCTSWGCEVNDNSTMGYWTSSPILSVANNAWYVRYAGRLYYSEVKNNTYYGLRPVISISKSVLS